MDEGDGDIKVPLGEEDEDLRYIDTNNIPLPLLIGQREIGQRFQHSTTQQFQKWGEESFVQRSHSYLHCQIPPTSKTTYLLAFSPDGSKVASSHGDHNIYVTDVRSGKCICTLKGHPRSPWCVAFHPSSNEIVASGCLGGEVRVWDLKGGSEVWSPDKKCSDKRSVIASLAFHPTDQVLVIATENDLYFWDWFCPEPFAKISTASKLEKVKYVEFDPLGYKLITGIAIARPERHPMEPNVGLGATTSTTLNVNNNSSSDQPQSMRSYITRSRTAHRIYRILDRSFRNANGQAANSTDEMSQPESGSSPSTYQRAFLNSDGRNRSTNQENDSGTVPGPSSLSDLNLQDASTTTSSLRRRYLLPRSSLNYFIPSEEEARMGDMRSFPRPASDDSASSSSLDSGSSATSGVSGASHERNTRLSLLWTSRLNRAGGGNESDNSAGGTYDLEERRGEGSVLRGGTRGLEPPAEERDAVVTDAARGNSRDAGAERRPTRISASDANYAGSRIASTSAYADENIRANEENEEESDGDLAHRSRQGQGGRWMYYRGKIPRGAPSRNRGPTSGPSEGVTGSSFRANSSRSSSSQTSLGNRNLTEDVLAIPGPSGLSGSSANFHGASQDPYMPDASTSSLSQTQAHLDPHFGVRLLSRHIENMQSICRSLSIPGTQLEMTRHRNEISQLQQIRSMLFDIQHQIRSLRASVDQTISEEFPELADENLNSLSVNPDPLVNELRSSGRGLTDEVELEVNIGTNDDQYRFSTLAEEDPDQLASAVSHDPIESLPSTEPVVSTLEPIPENEVTSRPSSSSSRHNNRTSRNSFRTLRNLALSRARSRRICRSRLVWTGLLRRLPIQRRLSRSRTTPPVSPATGSSPSSELDAGRAARRREMRESRLDKRRALLLSRRLEGRAGNEASSTPSEIGLTNQEEHVRRRHTADWQRRLRSINVLDQLRRRREESQVPNFTSTTPNASNHPGSGASSRAGTMGLRTAGIMPSTAFPRRSINSNSASSSRAASTLYSSANGHTTTVTLPITTTTTTTTSISTNAEAQPSNNSNNNTIDNNDSDSEIDSLPERVTRAGPPTTSLSSRIATMLAQQREARDRNSSVEETPAATGLTSSSSAGATPTTRTSGSIFRSRYDSGQGRFSRHSSSDFSSTLNPSTGSRNPLHSGDQMDDISDNSNEDSNAGDFLSLPVYESLRSLRREIIANRRNRMLRRYPSHLVSGGDLAGATLAEINPNLASEQERQRESFRQGRRESYRHMLQLMADRLNHMMNTSLSGSALLREGLGSTPFDNEDEEGEVMEHQNLRNAHNSRRGQNQRPYDHPFRGAGAFWSDYHNRSSSIDRHMHNLRLLVRLALHLIYQLLSFICNQNLSYEERPISRLPNPFREESEVGPRDQGSNQNSENGGSSVSNSFEMDIEPGLHNLTTLLETVRMASEELRQDALTNSDPPPARETRARRDEVRSCRNSMAAHTEASYSTPGASILSSPRTLTTATASVSNTITPLSTAATPTATSTPTATTTPTQRTEVPHSGSAVRRRLTNFLIRTGGYFLRAQNPNAVSATDGATRESLSSSDLRSSSAPIQRPLPTTPAVHFREIRAPFRIPQIVLNDVSYEGTPAAAGDSSTTRSSRDTNSPPLEEVGFHLRTFGGIPLRILGRQNAVDRRSPDSEDSSGNENNNNNNSTNNWDLMNEQERSFRYLSAGRPPFRYWNNLPYAGPGVPNPVLNPPYVERNSDRDAEQNFYNQTVFSHYIAASRNISGSLFDPFSPGLCNGNNNFYRIQAWDFRHYEIPDISDSYSNIVVQRCRIHFDASVSVSADGTLLAAVLPDTKTLTRIGVYSLETKTLGQLLYSSNIGFNIVCVSLSPTMRHLVVGISSHRLGVHHNDKQVIGRIYKLSHSKASYKGSYPGILRFCKSIELQSEFRQSSLNCIRWIPNPGHGLVYGTNRGQLTVIR